MALATVPVTLAMSNRALSAAPAAAIAATVAMTALQLCLDVSPRQERSASVGAGALAGVMGGVSTVTGPVLISCQMALRCRARNSSVASA